MNAKDLSSKVTTLTMIDRLLEAEILIDDSTRSYHSILKINSRFDFYRLLFDVFYYKVADLKKSLKPFETLIKNGEFNLDFNMDKANKELKITLSRNPDSDKIVQPLIKKEIKKR